MGDKSVTVSVVDVNVDVQPCLERGEEGTHRSLMLDNFTNFDSSGSCTQCEVNFNTSSHRAIQETCGHVKCRSCFIKNEQGCLQCRGECLPGQGQASAASTTCNEIKENSTGSSKKCLESISTTGCKDKMSVILAEKQKTDKPKWTSKSKQLFSGIKDTFRLKKINEKVKSYACGLCDRSFSKKTYFEYHNRTHTGERPFSCSICGKSFNRGDQLNRHMFCHNGESKSVCSLCDKKFMTKDALVIHVRSHTNERPFACDKCGKTYPSQASLNRHIVTHAETKDFLCSECGKTFLSNNTLSAHMLSHLRERNFPCDQCRARFKKQIDLDRHRLSHKELKRLPCPLPMCKRRFRRKDNLLRHLRLTHDLTKEQANESSKSVSTESTNVLPCNNGDKEDSGAEEIDIQSFENIQDQSIGLVNVDLNQERNGIVIAPKIDPSSSSVTFPTPNEAFGNRENRNYESDVYHNIYPVVSAITEPLPSLNSHRPLNVVPPTSNDRNVNNTAAATSVIRSVESLDPGYHQRQYVDQDLIPPTVTHEEPYPDHTNYYSTPEMLIPYETSTLRDDFRLQASSNNHMDSFRNTRSTVIDSITGSNLYLDVRFDNTHHYRQYLTPESAAQNYYMPENPTPPDYRITQRIEIPEYSRTLLDLSSHSREVYSTYPDAIAVEQLNNQRVSPSSRYPRINFQQEETRRPNNFTVIQRASPNYNYRNSTKTDASLEPSKQVVSHPAREQESSNTDTASKVTQIQTPAVVINPREGRNTPSSMNPSLNRDPRKNFLWENFNRINRD